MYKNLIQGKFSPAVAYNMRTVLLEKDADYETIRKYQYVLTSKGRQQRKLMFKRKVLQYYLDLKEQGINLTKKVISQKLLDEEANELAETYKEKVIADVARSLRNRQELFKKNEETPL